MKKIDLGTISMGNMDTQESYSPSEAYASVEVDTMKYHPEKLVPPECQASTDVCYNRCEEAKDCDFGEITLEGQGRILDLSMRLKNVCPGRRVALAVVLTEVDANNNEYPRGQKIVTIPAHNHSTCTDVAITKMRFVMPEDISVSGSDDVCCNCRHFIVRVTAHYIDSVASGCGCNTNNGCGCHTTNECSCCES